MSLLRLLIPYSSSPTGKSLNEGCCSSALTHATASLAVAIIMGTGVTLAAYFFTHGVILWTAVAGGGGAVVSGLVAYVIMRCACGKKHQDKENRKATDVDTVQNPDHDEGVRSTTDGLASKKQIIFQPGLL